MLQKVNKKTMNAAGARFAVVASRFNGRYVNALLRAATAELSRAGAAAVRVVRVPGAFEIPVVASRLAAGAGGRWSAIICLGVIFRGETTHAQHLGEAVSQALASLQTHSGVPIIHGVYLFENVEQARVRCLDPRHHRGLELAQTAVAMARVMRGLEA